MNGGRYHSRQGRYGQRGAKPKPCRARSVLAGAIPNIAIGARLHEYRIKKEWPAIVGKAIAKRTMPKSLIKGTLYCVVSSSAWMTELNYQKPLILEKINTSLKSGIIKEIVFKPGVLPAAAPEPPEEAPAKLGLTDSCIEDATAKISDDSLKKLISRVMKKSPF
ncbi:MAG: DUF721 domain-containing protein [Thermodesulfobacteriota bacterium]